jgi:hypothetical protein
MSAATTTPDRAERPAGRARARPTAPASEALLPCRIRLADGRVFTGELPAHRHRAVQLGLLHADIDGLVEIAAGRREDGRLRIITRPRPPRTRPDHFLPGGAPGQPGWLEALLALAERHAERGEEVFFAPAVRSEPRPDKHAVQHTHTLWVDVDRELVGDLPDPEPPRPARATRPAGGWQSDHPDAYKAIPPPVYFALLAVIDVPAGGGLVCCPAHEDRDPSCSVGARPEQGWRCHSDRCGARSAIYDLASVLLGGPTGAQLRGEQFKRAQAYVQDVFGELP